MSDDKKDYQFNTLLMHGGNKPDPAFGACTTPIYQNVSFDFPSAKEAADRFALRSMGQSYSRLTNPTTDALESRLAALEGGVGAITAASGHAAQVMAILPVVAPGEHIVASSRLYGGSTNQMKHTFPEHFGWKSTLVNPDDPANFAAAITDKTKVIFLESLSNPSGTVVDVEAVARIAEQNHIPLIVDNTVATPYLLRPLDHGAHIVTYSTTKFMTGNNTSLGGAVIDGGRFDWGKDDRYPALTKPNNAYNGTNFWETFGNAAYFVHTKAIGQRDVGASQQPMNAFLTLCGLETLHVRMQRHIENAQVVAEWLSKNPKIENVSYAGLPSSPYYALAQKYMPKGPGAVFTFDVKGTLEQAVRFIEALKMLHFVANIGDTRSLIIHPASTTHSQLSAEHRQKNGIGDGTMRISVGLEDPKDIIDDITQALEKV